MKSRSVESVLVIAIFGSTACVLPDVHDLGGSGGATGSTSTMGPNGSAAVTSVTGASSSASASTGSAPPVPCEGFANVTLTWTNVAPSATAVSFCLGSDANNVNGPVGNVVGWKKGVAYRETFTMKNLGIDGPRSIRVVDVNDPCSKMPGLAEISDYCMIDPSGSNSFSIFYVNGKKSGGSIVVLRDQLPNDGSLLLRFLNAAADEPSLDFGLTNVAALPANVFFSFGTKIEFRHLMQSGLTNVPDVGVDESGYLNLPELPAALAAQGWGVAIGTLDAVAITKFSKPEDYHGKVITLVAVGDGGTYPHDLLGLDQDNQPYLPQVANGPIFDKP